VQTVKFADDLDSTSDIIVWETFFFLVNSYTKE
jgi:hypothetical protein